MSGLLDIIAVVSKGKNVISLDSMVPHHTFHNLILIDVFHYKYIMTDEK